MNSSSHRFCENGSKIITGISDLYLSPRFPDCAIENAYVRLCKDISEIGNNVIRNVAFKIYNAVY
jgi:hypothetical protein